MTHSDTTFGTERLAALSDGVFARHAALERDLHHERSRPDTLMRHWRYHASVIPIVALISIGLIEVAEIDSLGVWIIEPVIAAASGRRQTASTGS